MDHILRSPLPWRSSSLTECGRDPDDVKTTLTLDQARKRVKELGIQRAAMTLCMTCAGRVGYYRTWDEDPVDVMRRHCAQGPDLDRTRQELRAVALLIAAHPDEFAEALTGLEATVSLADHRKGRRIEALR